MIDYGVPRVRRSFPIILYCNVIIVIIPQVGNEAFASFVDSNLNVSRVNNKYISHLFLVPAPRHTYM